MITSADGGGASLTAITVGPAGHVADPALRRVLENVIFDPDSDGPKTNISSPGFLDRLAARYRVLARALAGVDRELLEPLPFNSGCFALVELRRELGLDADAVRRELIASHSTGLIAIAPRFLRIAFCSVRRAALPELVTRLEGAVRRLAAGG